MSDWKNVQYKDGKYRTSEEGGGGSSTFAGLEDVSFSNLQNGQVPKYNSQTQKWENANESGGGASSIGDLSDVDLTNIADGDTLIYDAQNQEFVPGAPSGGGNVDDVEVNGVSVVNAQNVAEIKSYKEVTQAEYNALPASKTSDGILYCIKDSAGADGFPPLIYSDEEREIGVWRDGKPLYQKNFHFSIPQQLPKYGTPGFKVGTVLNIETIVDFSGISTNYNEQRLTTSFSIWLENTNDIYLSLQTGHANPAIYLNDLTLQYTKTTDVAGSGTWTTQGGYTHHYSTTEQVVGTWIDGKSLYEKTIDTGLIPSNTTKQIPHNIANIAKIVDYRGMALDANGSDARVMPYMGFNNWSIVLYVTPANVCIQTGQNWGNDFPQSYVTIQYTKTTD